MQNKLDIHALDFSRFLELLSQAIWLSRTDFLFLLQLIKIVQNQAGPIHS